MKKARVGLCKAVKAGEQSGLETLVDLFDWLDSLDAQPTAGIVSLYEDRQKDKVMISNTLAPVGPAMADNAENSVVSFHLLAPSARILCSPNDVNAFSNFQRQPMF